MIDGLTNALAGAKIDAFEFMDGDRTFRCEAEARRGTQAEGWWWFRVTPDARGQRYAPFRTQADDTRDDVQARILAYYDDLLVRRATPATHNHWGRRPGAAAAPAEPSAPSISAPVS